MSTLFRIALAVSAMALAAPDAAAAQGMCRFDGTYAEGRRHLRRVQLHDALAEAVGGPGLKWLPLQAHARFAAA
jgi:hypothetical protein